jgi:hypothetical protein
VEGKAVKEGEKAVPLKVLGPRQKLLLEVNHGMKSCFQCEFHAIKQDGKEETSHCRRENCWSRYSKCLLVKALEKFLKEESSRYDGPFSAL